MLLNGAAALGRSRCTLEDVYFVAPLVLSGTAPTNHCRPSSSSDSKFQIISFQADAAADETDQARDWTAVLPEAGANPGSPMQAAGRSIELQARCNNPLDLNWLTTGSRGSNSVPVSAGSMASGPMATSETLARLRLPDAVTDASDYWFHSGTA